MVDDYFGMCRTYFGTCQIWYVSNVLILVHLLTLGPFPSHPIKWRWETVDDYFGMCQRLNVSNLFWYVSKSGTCQTYLVRVKTLVVRVKIWYVSKLFWFLFRWE